MAKGEHRKDKYRTQAYYLAKDKALMVMVAKHDKVTLTDSIMKNAVDRAKALRLVDKDGNALPEYQEELELEMAIIQQGGNNK